MILNNYSPFRHKISFLKTFSLFFILFLTVTILLSPLLPLVQGQEIEKDPQVMVIHVKDTITAGKAQYLQSNLNRAIEEEMDGVIILLDTPGGLVDATLEIIKDLLNSPVPVITYVYPRGAIAASAGTYILLAGHIAVMAPATTCGAAMPVAMHPTEGEAQPADDKTINLLAGHMKSTARERNRPLDVAERFVTENLSLDAEEAKEKGVIDYIEGSIPELLNTLDGKDLQVMGELVELNLSEARLIEPEMTTQEVLIDFVSNPQIAFLLFLIGFYGLIFGLNMPGTYVVETLGLLALVLALYGLGMFSTNVVGILLIVMAVTLFIAEVFTPSFGFFTIAGIISLVLGALFLPLEPLLPLEWFRAFRLTVYGMAVVTGGFLLLVITRLLPLRNITPFHKQEGMIGYSGVVTEELNPWGMIKIRGEWWNARSKSGKNIPSGTRVKVVEREGMTLLVERED